MRRLVLVLPLLLFFLSVSLINSGAAQISAFATASIWEECPDDAIVGSYNIVENICIDDSIIEKVSRNVEIYAIWYDAPQVNTINSIDLITNMRGCESECSSTFCNQDYTNINIFVWSEGYGGWKKTNENFVPISNDSDYIFNVTEWMTPNGSGAYKTRIINLGRQEQERCLWVDYVGLKITYHEMGETRIWVSSDIPIRSVPKYSAFDANGDILCTGGDCGDVDAYVKYATDRDGTYSDIPPSGFQLYTNPNPYGCGDMDHLDTCSPEWTVTANNAGNYWIKMFTDAESAPDNQTGPIMVSVNEGVLDLSGSIAYNTINLLEPVGITGEVGCGTAPCGEVKMITKYKKVGSDRFEPLGSLGNLSTGNTNPYICGPMYPSDQECITTWNIYGNVPGYYQIIIVAYSDDEDVTNRTYDFTITVNPEETVGVLSIPSFTIDPGEIKVGEDATLSGTISCSEEYCGDVSVYVMSTGDKVEDNGIGTDDYNPQICSNMNNSDQCSVSWIITGNDAGNHYMELVADSDQDGVENRTSSIVFLDVTNPVGDLSFPYEPSLDPQIISISDTATLHAAVECTSSDQNPYCGQVTARVEYDGIVLGSSGDLFSNDHNPQVCVPMADSLCDFTWIINSSESDGYTVSLLVTSNESNDQLTRSFGLTVSDPEKPGLSVSMGNVQDHELGDSFTLSGNIECSNGNCGEVSVYAKYKLDEQDPWTDLSSTSVIFSDENPKIIDLNSGESKSVEWIISSSQLGNYILGISADATDGNVIDSGTTSKELEIFEGIDIGIEILSPSGGQLFSRGDELLVKIKVTENDYPMAGGFVTASSDGFFSTQLDYEGNGIYYKTISIADSVVKNSYIIKTYVKKDIQTFSEDTNVYVNPELEVSVNSDKYQYEILEKVRLQGQVLKKGKPIQATVKLELICPARSFKEILLETDSSGNFYHEYLISMATPTETCEFEFYTEDQYNNYNSTSLEVGIFSSENEVYGIEFIQPVADTKFQKGDPVRIRTKVTYGGEPIEGAVVSCISPLLEDNIRLSDTGDGSYDGEYIIEKSAPSDLWILTCVAAKNESFGRKSVNVHITPLEIKLTEITPSTNDFFQPGDTAKIRLRLAYPDNSPFGNSTVYVKIGNKIIYLNETEPGFYEGDYDVKDQGIFAFDVYAEDQFGNSDMFSSGVVIMSGFAPLNLIWIVLPFVVAVGLLAGVVWKRGKREIIIKENITEKPKTDKKTEIKEKIAELDRKIKDVEKAKDEVENEYYERKIDEKTFNRMIQNYEQDRIKFSVERDSLIKDLEKL